MLPFKRTDCYMLDLTLFSKISLFKPFVLFWCPHPLLPAYNLAEVGASQLKFSDYAYI